MLQNNINNNNNSVGVKARSDALWKLKTRNETEIQKEGRDYSSSL